MSQLGHLCVQDKSQDQRVSMLISSENAGPKEHAYEKCTVHPYADWKL